MTKRDTGEEAKNQSQECPAGTLPTSNDISDSLVIVSYYGLLSCNCNTILSVASAYYVDSAQK